MKKLSTIVVCYFLFNVWIWAQPDLNTALMATQTDIDQFNKIKTYQLGVGILGGGTTKPFYYNHNQPNERTYKYKKKTIVGVIDAWYPVGPDKITVCGSLVRYNEVSDLKHTWATKDRDYCFHIIPSAPFQYTLNNRWNTEKRYTEIEGEVSVKDLDRAVLDPNRRYQDKYSTTNPIFDDEYGPVKQEINQNVCVHGSWMLDKMASTPIAKKHDNNEIHPINQFWFVDNANTLNLTSVVDGTGYFDKSDATQVSASGKNLPMSYYIAFNLIDPNISKKIIVSGTSYDTPMPNIQSVDKQSISLNWNGKKILEVEKQYLDNKKSFTVSFDRVKKLASGKIIGYIVIETLPISEDRGSVTVNVKTVSGSLMERTPECDEIGILTQQLSLKEAEITKYDKFLLDTKGVDVTKTIIIKPTINDKPIPKKITVRELPKGVRENDSTYQRLQTEKKQLLERKANAELNCL